jgi:hypothetical protein
VTDPGIVHTKGKRLAAMEHYGLDQTIGPFELQRELFGLIEAISKLGVANHSLPHVGEGANRSV